jgi:MFS family permease
MTSLLEVAHRTFRALRIYNYRLFFFSQIVSMSGTWMQSVALGWLVLDLGGDSVDLGITVGLQFGPILVLGAWAGALADRHDKRRLLVLTQSAAAALALVLGGLTLADVITIWMVWVLAGLLGIVVAMDMPARQSFVYEMAGPDDLANAVGLNAVVINSSRIVGPAIGGLLIASLGVAACFLLNGASFAAVIVALLVMRRAELFRAKRAARRPGQIREGLRYTWSTPALRVPILMMAVVSTLAYNFSVVLPLLARVVYDRGGGAYGATFSAMGVGALAGALFMASRARPSRRLLVASTFAFGVFSLALAAAPAYAWALAVLVPLGATGVLFVNTTNALLQVNAADAMRGRVMSLWAIVFFGSTPIGGPLTGLVARAVGVQWAVAIGGVATLATAAGAYWALRRSRVESGACEAPACLPDDLEPERVLPIPEGASQAPSPAVSSPDAPGTSAT